MAEQKPIVVVGSINIDLVMNTERIPVEGETITGKDFQVHPGGKGANQAVAVGKLGYPVQMIGRVGSDAFGQQLRSNLEQSGVDTASVTTTEGSSGVAVILVNAKGENCIVITPGANAKLTPQDIDANVERIRSAGIVLTQLETPLDTIEHLANLCEREGVPLMLDPAPARELPAQLLRKITWFTPNETEAAFYCGASATANNEPSAIAKQLFDKGIEGVILKLGSRGSYLARPSETGHTIAPFPVKAIDTTAAGDAFNGAFATALMMGKSEQESARFASAAAAISVTRKGAQPSLATMAEVQALLAK